MARKPRTNIISNYVHVMAQGIDREYIFNESQEIKFYLKILSENIQKCNVKVVSYCVMNNHVHLLFYAEDTKEISKIMSKTNTKYAIYYNKKHNRVGYVFRNRYRSEEIMSKAHLLSCINYIHDNPVKASICKKREEYKFSSYTKYNCNSKILDVFYIKKILREEGIEFDSIFNNKYEMLKFIECEEVNIDKDSVCREKIKDFLTKFNISEQELKENIKLLKQLVKLLYYENNIQQKKIAEILKLSKVKINRMIHSDDEI